MQIKRIVIVGGGPAGMMAAIRAAGLRQEVTLVEKNSTLGRKLLLSGKGRCNLTNTCDPDSFIASFSGNGQFLRDAFKKFFYRDLMRFFEERGLRLKVERQLRVFPVTDKSSSVLDVLLRELEKSKVKILFNSAVRNIIIIDNKAGGVLLRDGNKVLSDKVILATGGLSYAFTGSSGEGIKLAKESGHRIVPVRAGLVPLITKEKYPQVLEGLVLKNIRLTFGDSKKEIVSPVGELLFTGSGISGPLVLSLSAKVVDWLEAGRNIFAGIDLKPALSKEQLDSRILRELAAAPNKSIKNLLKELLPASLIGVFLGTIKIDPDKKANQVTQKERSDIVDLLKDFRLHITAAKSIEEGMITQGGVCLKDINPRTMESRVIKDLYFCGEMIDIDADTGGFNLQAAFSTGYLAGESAALN